MAQFHRAPLPGDEAYSSFPCVDQLGVTSLPDLKSVSGCRAKLALVSPTLYGLRFCSQERFDLLVCGRVFTNHPNPMSLARMWLSNQLPTSLADSQSLANVLGIVGLCLSAFALGVLGDKDSMMRC